jgi:hypothetical protein
MNKSLSWWIFDELNEQLDDFKFQNTPGAILVSKYMRSANYYTQINDLKNKYYEIIYKMMNMKFKRGSGFQISKLEKAMLTACELKLFNAKQIDNLLALYQKFCQKIGINSNDIFVDNLDKLGSGGIGNSNT